MANAMDTLGVGEGGKSMLEMHPHHLVGGHVQRFTRSRLPQSNVGLQVRKNDSSCPLPLLASLAIEFTDPMVVSELSHKSRYDKLVTWRRSRLTRSNMLVR